MTPLYQELCCLCLCLPSHSDRFNVKIRVTVINNLGRDTRDSSLVCLLSSRFAHASVTKTVPHLMYALANKINKGDYGKFWFYEFVDIKITLGRCIYIFFKSR